MELKINKLTKQYGNKLAVDRFSATFTEGINGLLGANGSGKTTLMRMMCDILRPTSGEVLLDGVNITTLDEAYRELLGYLPQNFGYYPDFSAWDFMIYFSSLKGLPRLVAENRCKELLDIVGLYEVRKKKIKTYSGGMRQRLGIAQALINDPKILILDEPTVGLDPKERAKFRNIISDHSTGKIILLSTHIVSDVEYIADRIMIMKDGQLSQQATTDRICDSIKDFVWSLQVNPKDVDNYNSKFIVSNLKHSGEMVELRIVSEERPSENAVNVLPSLEDLYLYHFKGEV
ncbi:ABC-type multidrug transport system, ATpase component [Clostridium aceticum]|uniref:ABC-type multidrug transport system, ATpase component n=1 Tax=Clostridium aceticum TaxID=84022 RepID=A0A0D8IAN6_9CLOT|nr:ABC transporter ATP-binding protein [Clostridium aceticum]AKL96498.1 ABC-type multidrug transport system, ATpase component [Clostridium aceticum]KJF27330.1 ABC transporter ATP-binding protein [Clostridium aceticum]